MWRPTKKRGYCETHSTKINKFSSIWQSDALQAWKNSLICTPWKPSTSGWPRKKNGCMNGIAKRKSRCRNTASSSRMWTVFCGWRRERNGRKSYEFTENELSAIPQGPKAGAGVLQLLWRELSAAGQRWRMCLCAKYFLFAAVPVVPGRRSPAGYGPVCRDHERPGWSETLLRVWRCIYAEVQTGQILPILRQTDAPPQRGRTAAEKVLAIYAFRALKSLVFRGLSDIVAGVVGWFIIYPPKRCSKCVEIGKKEICRTRLCGSLCPAF